MREENMTAAETRYKACFFCEGERGTNYSASDLGGFTGSLAMGAAGHFYQKKKNNEAVEEAEKEGRTATDADGNPLTKDPLGGVENFLAGMYESICGSFSRLKEGDRKSVV